MEPYCMFKIARGECRCSPLISTTRVSCETHSFVDFKEIQGIQRNELESIDAETEPYRRIFKASKDVQP